MFMSSFWEAVDKVIWDSDIVVLLLDARLVKESRNREVEEKVRALGKPVIYVITKADLADKDAMEAWKRRLRPCVFVSSRERWGLGKLRERILIEASRLDMRRKTIRVGVLGYPNVGKSSLVNAMKGKHSAPTSPATGFTKGIQKVRADKRILFLDTPGVIPYNEDDEAKHAMMGAKDFSKARDPDLAAMRLMERFPGRIERHFGVRNSRDKEDTLNEIAVKKHLLMKGGKPDVLRAARMILKAWQRGDIS
jgi:ribosome biogenesis GTPase A